jgi:Clp amino terminal domain, pathogenicity island component
LADAVVGGWLLLSGAGRWKMFERFSDRARRVVVLAQQEARTLDHDYIGPEHLLLGLIHEGKGVGVKALEAMGISLEELRREVEGMLGRGQAPPAGHIPFTPPAKKVLELSLRESRQLGHDYIGTEHILLGLIREGESGAAQVLVRSGAELTRTRDQVIQLLGQYRAAPAAAGGEPDVRVLLSHVQVRLAMVEKRLVVVEQRVGTGPDTGDLDDQIERLRGEIGLADDAQDPERAASLRDREQELLAAKTARKQEWADAHPDLPSLAEQCQQLSDEVERLRGLLRQHGIGPGDEPA